MLGFLNHWWNLPFLVMLGLVLTSFGAQMLGLVGDHGDHDLDGDADADLDADADGAADPGDAAAHVDTETDVDIDHDGDVAHAHVGRETDHGGEGIRALLGIGRVPFSVIWTTLFAFTGLSGLCLNYVCYTSAGADYSGWHFALAATGGLGIGTVAVRLFSRVAARLVDIGGKGSVKKQELVGHPGVVASAQLDKQFGEVRVHDDLGNELLVHGCLRDDEPVLGRGAKVVLVDYDEQRGLFWVSAHPSPDEPLQQGPVSTGHVRGHRGTALQNKT